MIDSRQKGRTAENNAKKTLIDLTGLGWERTPMSGALDPKHKLKGDLYIPGENLIYCVEVKHYKDDHLTSKLITSANPMLLKWWDQTVREAKQIGKEPLLLFKYNRSRWFTMFNNMDIYLAMADGHERFLTLSPDELYISTLTNFCVYAEFIE